MFLSGSRGCAQSFEQARWGHRAPPTASGSPETALCPTARLLKFPDVSTELPEHHAATQRRARESGRLVLRGIILNAVLAAVKFAGGIFGHTYALIADGAESLIDILSSLVVWAGF